MSSQNKLCISGAIYLLGGLMEWKKILKASLIPTIALLIVGIPMFDPVLNYLSLLCCLSPLLSSVILLYAGYSAVKKYESNPLEAGLTGALVSYMSYILPRLLVALLVFGGGYGYFVRFVSPLRVEEGEDVSTVWTTSVVAIATKLLITVTFYIIIGAVLGMVGGYVAQKISARQKSEDMTPIAEKKPEKIQDLMLYASTLLTLISIAGVFVVFYLSVSELEYIPEPPRLECIFQSGEFFCHAKVYSDTGYLKLQLTPGNNETILVNGIVCVQNKTQPSYINNYADDPVILIPRYRFTPLLPEVSLPGTSHAVRCTDAAGDIPKNTSIGEVYAGWIFVNYTINETGETKIAVGKFTDHFSETILLPSGMECTTKKLHAASGSLDLEISQKMGEPIQINGIACRKSTYARNVSYGGYSITINNGNSAYIAKANDPERPWLKVICTDEKGDLLQNNSVGAVYYGTLYINYTRIETGMKDVAKGEILAIFEQ